VQLQIEVKGMDQQQAKFEGWAIVEMMGHQREIGFVTTEYFGGAALFRVDTPEIPEREFELTRPEYMNVGSRYAEVPAGSKVKRPALPAKSRLVAPAALYALTPCTEETARKAIEEHQPRALIVLDIPQSALPAAEIENDDTEGDSELCGCKPGEYCDECSPI
jgi:hypothetical protein